MPTPDDKGPPKLKEYQPQVEEDAFSEETWLERTAFGKWLGRPCIASSFASGCGAGFATFLTTFGWTSNVRKANNYMVAAFAVVTLASNGVCAWRKLTRDNEKRENEKKKDEETARRRAETRAKIEARKRLHEERKESK